MSPETEAFLASVREAEDPSAEDEQRVLRAVRVALAAGVVAGAAAGGSKLSKLGSGLGVNALKGTVVMLGVVAGAKLLVSETSAPAYLAQPARSAAARPQPATSQVAPREVTAANPPATVAAPKPSSRGPAGSPPEATAPIELSRPATARAELAVLAEAQAALRAGDGSLALGVLDAHPADPRFLAERSALRVLALCAAGRVAEARREAAAFSRAEPTSIQRAAVARSCAADEVE
ncbi:MAG TPA: hypothetical protein VGK73_16575 [Polyangiaceae bacterium]